MFVNSAVLSLDTYINVETLVIGYDTEKTTTDITMMIATATATNNLVTRIGFAFHYSPTDPILFLNGEPFFTDFDLEESVEIYSQNVQFLMDLILLGKITHVDFLACNTLQSEKWRLFYNLLQLKTGVVIGASDNNTGNLLYGGDWVMESTHEEVGQIYFTPAIENWASFLALPTGLNTYYHTFYTMNSADANAGKVMTRKIYNNSGTLLESQDISFGTTMSITAVLSLMDGGGMNPYTIGIVDSSQNKICMDIAYCNVYTKPLTTIQQTKLMTYVNTTFLEPHTASESSNTYVVTVVGSAFSLTGSNGVSSSSMLMTYGKVYILDQSDSSNAGKQLIIYTNTANTNRYYTGVVTNGTPGTRNAYTLIDLSSSVAGATLYYGIGGGVFYTSAASSMVKTNVTNAASTETFTVSFYSSLPAGTPVSYTITNCLASDLGLASLDNLTFTSPYQEISFTVAAITGTKNITITSGNSINLTLTSPAVKYVMGSISYALTSSAGNYGTNTLNTMAYSYNGTNWTGLGKSIFSVACLSVAYGNNMWVAGGVGTNDLAYSLDGISWTGLGRKFVGNNPFDGQTSTKTTKDWANGCMRVKFMNNRFVATGAYGSSYGYLFHSSDGINWYQINLQSIGGNDWSSSHDADWNGYGWVCTTYSSLYFIVDSVFNTTASIPVVVGSIGVNESNMQFTSACVNGYNIQGGGTTVQVYVPRQGVYNSGSGGVSAFMPGQLYFVDTYTNAYISVYGNIAFTTIIKNSDSTCYGTFQNTTTAPYFLDLVRLTYRTSESSSVYNNVGIVHNMYYDKWTSAWYISSDQGLMKKNTLTYSSLLADYAFTVVVPYANDYGFIHTCCSSKIGTRLDIV